MGIQDWWAGPQPEQLCCCQSRAGISPQHCPVLCVVSQHGSLLALAFHPIQQFSMPNLRILRHKTSNENTIPVFKKFLKYLCFKAAKSWPWLSFNVCLYSVFSAHIHEAQPQWSPSYGLEGPTGHGHHIPAVSANFSPGAWTSEVHPWSRKFGNSLQILSNKWQNIEMLGWIYFRLILLYQFQK